MRELFQKGSIVPRRLGLVMTTDRKAQHCLNFGCDVYVDGKTLYLIGDGSVFLVRRMGRPMRNGTRKKVSIRFGLKGAVSVNTQYQQQGMAEA